MTADVDKPKHEEEKDAFVGRSCSPSANIR